MLDGKDNHISSSKILIVILLISCLSIILIFFDNDDWSSEKYFYKQAGTGGYFNGIAWATILDANNIGQWTHTNKKYGYGDFSWDGIFMSKGKEGWSIQGLTDGKACKYIAFELIYTDRVFRCITYNKNSTDEHKNTTFATVLRFFNFAEWNHYKIRWRPQYCAFFINNIEVANHTQAVPHKKLYFHVHTCVAPWQHPPGGWLCVAAKNFEVKKWH